MKSKVKQEIMRYCQKVADIVPLNSQNSIILCELLRIKADYFRYIAEAYISLKNDETEYEIIIKK